MTTAPSEAPSSAVATIPNALSLARVLLIPAFVWLIVDRDTTFAGLVLFVVVISTDWVDGYVARRTGRVSELGMVLDPTADRLAMAAALVALVVRGAFPLWAALLILVRDGLVLLAGLVLLLTRRVRIDVRLIGKLATFGLMTAIVLIAWGALGYAFAAAALALGWIAYVVAIVEYLLATVLYAGDLRRALTTPST
ncbi:MAG: CDP-alcohol phosphatidyltransferase family protein [Actinomycetota bacterium]